jgi:hypothetical protein
VTDVIHPPPEEEPPPCGGTWLLLYTVVVANLLFWIALFVAVTRAFS